MVSACAKDPAGTLFRTTVEGPDGSYAQEVVLGDQTGLVTVIVPPPGAAKIRSIHRRLQSMSTTPTRSSSSGAMAPVTGPPSRSPGLAIGSICVSTHARSSARAWRSCCSVPFGSTFRADRADRSTCAATVTCTTAYAGTRRPSDLPSRDGILADRSIPTRSSTSCPSVAGIRTRSSRRSRQRMSSGRNTLEETSCRGLSSACRRRLVINPLMRSRRSPRDGAS